MSNKRLSPSQSTMFDNGKYQESWPYAAEIEAPSPMEELMLHHSKNMTYFKRCRTQAMVLYRRLMEIRTRYQHARDNRMWQWVYTHYLRMLIVEGLIVAFHTLAAKTFDRLLDLEVRMGWEEESDMDIDSGDDLNEDWVQL
ncbi:uncharacterized protein [Haliotis cracherodii]|uniref:uncharacterized protein n=1 Tax=Haliotis cracherodii TaxID=6455 RepID=UPI0039EBC2BF